MVAAVHLHDPKDPREERTVRRLSQAVLAIAVEQDITKTSVAEVARKAGINRSTFYAYATSPVALLTSVLYAELDIDRRKNRCEMKAGKRVTRDILRRPLEQIADHVEQHIGIYAGPHQQSACYAMRVILAEHVEQSVLETFAEGSIELPATGSPFTAMSASFLAHGIVGAVEAWLQLPAPRSRSVLFEAIEQMYPPWFAQTSS
ncbi:TetR/AcrR family transcriptional regulator [Salinicola sp. CPA57]|uniref:TetR/AcrR family transcriptional regulator n=1 Tax=Salinicola sp. CPA57 TaxID=1949080 RepID=UPI000DA17651|nr:TetR/AcrR family transcriptional regulator [Salinicola sp. CPA57]